MSRGEACAVRTDWIVFLTEVNITSTFLRCSSAFYETAQWDSTQKQERAISRAPSLCFSLAPSPSFFPSPSFPPLTSQKKESNQTGHMSVEISMTTLVKMHPSDLILNKCNVPNLGLFINGVARKAFVAASEIKIWLENIWRNCFPCVYGTETIPTLVQTCLGAIHPVFNLYRSEGEDRHYVPFNSDCLSMMP